MEDTMATQAQIRATAQRGRYTKFVLVECGPQDLYLWVRPETDFDDEFVGICDDTGDVLRVQGWNCLVRDIDY